MNRDQVLLIESVYGIACNKYISRWLRAYDRQLKNKWAAICIVKARNIVAVPVIRLVTILAFSESAIEEVTSSLHGKAVKFMMTHDVELRLPSFLFDDAVLRISPRSLEGNGALVKVEFVPKQVAEARDESRIFKKKIREYAIWLLIYMYTFYITVSCWCMNKYAETFWKKLCLIIYRPLLKDSSTTFNT